MEIDEKDNYKNQNKNVNKNDKVTNDNKNLSF
jgi:hypothetical protein